MLGTGGAAQIKDHPWFAGIEWDKLYEMEAAFKPEVNGELDTQNCMKFDELHLNPKDLSFVGCTYKNYDAVKALRYSSDHTRSASPRRPSIDSISGDNIMRTTPVWTLMYR